MTVIYATVTDATGSGLKNEFVHVSLVSVSMWNATGKYRVSRVASRMTNNVGYVEFDLPPQTSYADSGTYYRFEHGSTVDYFTVPDTGGPYSLFNRLRDPLPESTKYKVTPYLRELTDAPGAANATDGQTLGYDATAKLWLPVTRATLQQLADGLAPKATTAAMNSADTALQTRATSLEGRATSLESGLATKASSATVSSIDGRVTTNTGDISTLKTKVQNLEGGGTGGAPAPLHSGLRGLVTDPSTGNVTDDHPQYLNTQRGDARYYPRADAQQAFAQLKHAARHAKDGGDPVTPVAIGAADRGHGLAEHSVAAGQLIVPFITTADVDATAAKPSHAGLSSKVGSTARDGGFIRSLRQPVVHEFDGSIPNIIPVRDTIFYTYNFTTREPCDLFLSFMAYGYYYANNHPMGAAASVHVFVRILDRDNNNAVLHSSDNLGIWVATVQYNGFRPLAQLDVNFPLLAPSFPAGKNLQLQLLGTKDQTGNADLVTFYCRGSVTEVARVGAA